MSLEFCAKIVEKSRLIERSFKENVSQFINFCQLFSPNNLPPSLPSPYRKEGFPNFPKNSEFNSFLRITLFCTGFSINLQNRKIAKNYRRFYYFCVHNYYLFDNFVKNRFSVIKKTVVWRKISFIGQWKQVRGRKRLQHTVKG